VRLLAIVAVAAASALLSAPAAAQSPIAGGGSFNDAPVLEPGRYADTLRGGEQLFYGVELQPGQSVQASATVTGRSTTSYFMDLKLYSPQRQEIGDASVPFRRAGIAASSCARRASRRSSPGSTSSPSPHARAAPTCRSSSTPGSRSR
jgi:hypothetical protein